MQSQLFPEIEIDDEEDDELKKKRHQRWRHRYYTSSNPWILQSSTSADTTQYMQQVWTPAI